MPSVRMRKGVRCYRKPGTQPGELGLRARGATKSVAPLARSEGGRTGVPAPMLCPQKQIILPP